MQKYVYIYYDIFLYIHTGTSPVYCPQEIGGYLYVTILVVPPFKTKYLFCLCSEGRFNSDTFQVGCASREWRSSQAIASRIPLLQWALQKLDILDHNEEKQE